MYLFCMQRRGLSEAKHCQDARRGSINTKAFKRNCGAEGKSEQDIPKSLVQYEKDCLPTG